MSCKNCYWLMLNTDGKTNKTFKCKIKDKEFNNSKFHGLFCGVQVTEEEMIRCIKRLFKF